MRHRCSTYFSGFLGRRAVSNTKKITLAGLFAAIGMILPLFTGQIQEFGNMLLPMHLPVFLCGYVCGGRYGMMTGMMLPVLRSVLFGMPPLMPQALSMALELGTYGGMAGFFYRKLPKTPKGIYIGLTASMLIGRAVWGIAAAFFYGAAGIPFGINVFLGGALLEAFPGIVLQLILIPVLIFTLEKAGLL